MLRPLVLLWNGTKQNTTVWTELSKSRPSSQYLLEAVALLDLPTGMYGLPPGIPACVNTQPLIWDLHLLFNSPASVFLQVASVTKKTTSYPQNSPFNCIHSLQGCNGSGFFTAACKAPWFRFVSKTVLITHKCFSYRWRVFAQHQCLLGCLLCPQIQVADWGWARGWEGTLDRTTDPNWPDNPCHLTSCSAMERDPEFPQWKAVCRLLASVYSLTSIYK